MVIESKEDRRVRKTKKALRDGLVELLHEKSIQNITVRELTDKADVHRSTFYANFKDVYELYNHVEGTVIQEISDIVLVDNGVKPIMLFKELLEYANENRQVSRLFFGGNINAAFFENLTGVFKAACLDCWCDEYNITNVTEEMDYYVQFYLSGCLGAIGLWVSRDFEYPLETLVELLSDIDSDGGRLFGDKFS